MSNTVPAIFENGLLRPLEELPLRQNQRVVLHVEEVADSADELEDIGFAAYCRHEGDPSITVEEVRAALAVIPGTLTAACSAERDED
jgi:predicted DNA-binding antitoxin AbrB/MazE fold protein